MSFQTCFLTALFIVVIGINKAQAKGPLCSGYFLTPDKLSEVVKVLLETSELSEYVQGVREDRATAELQTNLASIYKQRTQFEEQFTLEQIVNAALKLPKDATTEQKQAAEKKHISRILAKAMSKLRNAKNFTQRNMAQLKALPQSLSKAKKMLHSELSPKNLDEHVFDFYGYLNLKLFSSGLRSWDAVENSFDAIKPRDVVNMDPTTWAEISMLASEIEKPIDEYSDNSGETLRVLSPQASRFMGKTSEESEYMRLNTKGERRSRCTNSWCFEENRHELTLARMARAITGRKLEAAEIFDAYEGLDPLRIDDAYFHLLARNDTEWHAGSAYYFLGIHAEGALKTWIGNVRKDEIKHQSLFGGLYKYLRGDTYWSRFNTMLKKMMYEIKEKSGKTNQADVFKEAATAVEFIYIHAVYEAQIRKLFKSIPLKTLRKVYETEINLQPLPAVEIEPIKKARLDEAIPRETQNRMDLKLWPKKLRDQAFALEKFEQENSSMINDLVTNKFSLFEGAETYDSRDHKTYKFLIQSLKTSYIYSMYGVKLTRAEMKLLKKSLTDSVRDYQIFNNRSVREQNLNVEYLGVQRGFDIVKDENFAKARKVRE